MRSASSSTLSVRYTSASRSTSPVMERLPINLFHCNGLSL
jgi:hypothetical protein